MSRDFHFIVTGTGHTGTGWMSRAMTNVGHKCGHEKMYGFGDPASSWFDYEGDSSWPAAPLIPTMPNYWPIVHLVRDPLKVVGSAYDMGFLRFRCDCGHIPGTHVKGYVSRFTLQALPDLWSIDSDVDRIISWVVQWNEMVEEFLDDRFSRRYRIEDVSNSPEAFSDMVVFLTGVRPRNEKCEEVIRSLPTNYNTHRLSGVVPDFSHGGEWVEKLNSLSIKYGYGGIDGHQ